MWLWFKGDRKRLGRRVSQILQNEDNELWLSPVSTWEALTLQEKGRIKLPGTITEWVTKATEGFKEAVLTHEIALAARELPLHEDPADRMIAATAKVLDLTLVTADERLLGLRNIQTLGNS
jgi:PIN domain nuclease of toxin-antitoxin system